MDIQEIVRPEILGAGRVERHLLIQPSSVCPSRDGNVGSSAKAVQAFVTVEKWKTLRHIVTETQRTANDLIDEAIEMRAEKDCEPKMPSQHTRKRGGPHIPKTR
jgi:hypothetical protein